jgi:UDP-3-O-[3-hydroxymyristoyl] glucosamine N-acyltransferase
MKTLPAIATEIGATLSHASQLTITRVSAFSNATPHSLVFVDDAASLPTAIASGAGAVIAPVGTTTSAKTPLLLCAEPRLAFARAARFLKQQKHAEGFHPTAFIADPYQFGRGVTIGSHTSIGDAPIGEDTKISSGCSIADGVKIGRACVIYPNVTIYPGTTLGDRVVVHAGAVLGADGFGYVRDPDTGEYLQFPQQGKLVIEDDVEIGANTTIDRGALEETRIGRGTKIDNLVHIGHNCRIGKNVVIASQTGISGSCVIGDGVVMGGQVGMGDHVTIDDGVILGGGAGILPHKKITGANQVFWGTPARPLKQYLKELATLATLSRKSGARA